MLLTSSSQCETRANDRKPRLSFFFCIFKNSPTVTFAVCWIIFKVYCLLSLKHFWWSSDLYKYLIPYVFLLLFVSSCSHGASLELWKWRVKCEKHPTFIPSPVPLFTVWIRCRKWGCSGINDATRVSKFLEVAVRMLEVQRRILSWLKTQTMTISVFRTLQICANEWFDSSEETQAHQWGAFGFKAPSASASSAAPSFQAV